MKELYENYLTPLEKAPYRYIRSRRDGEGNGDLPQKNN